VRTDGFRHAFGCCLSVALALCATTVVALAEGASGSLLPPGASPVENPAPAAKPPRTSEPKPRISHAPTNPHSEPLIARAPAKRSPPAPVVAHAFPPPAGETRFRRAEVLVEFVPRAAGGDIDQVLRRHRLTQVETDSFGLIGAVLRLVRFTDARDVGAVVRELGAEPLVASAQPNYVYTLQDDAAPAGPPQYALAKLHVDKARAETIGDKILVAVVDTAIDEAHPDLAGAVAARFDALGGATSATAHGTAIAGAIAAHGRIRGVAPQAGILSARAFDSAETGGPEGSTLSILKGVDWAAGAHARIINMSFAGPSDPAMHRVLAAAFAKGIALVAAAGNAGPKSAPLYPGADADVLAVTATDADDKLFENANVGRYVAVAAPGVDVLLPAPDGKYALETGTSVAAALVSGVAALVLELRPAMQPPALRKLLTTTAHPLGAGGHETDFGAGLVDAQRALADVSAAR
jgi:subtilisin family serine protease